MRILVLICVLIFEACVYFERPNWSSGGQSGLKPTQHDPQRCHTTPLWTMLMRCTNQTQQNIKSRCVAARVDRLPRVEWGFEKAHLKKHTTHRGICTYTSCSALNVVTRAIPHGDPQGCPTVGHFGLSPRLSLGRPWVL